MIKIVYCLFVIMLIFSACGDNKDATVDENKLGIIDAIRRNKPERKS